jgi:hypothetical protein
MNGAALNAKASTASRQDSRQNSDSLLPISDASERLKLSPWALKRMHKAGNLPAVIANKRWFVPESFVAMVLGSPRPGRAGVIEEVAAEWFAAHASEAVA